MTPEQKKKIAAMGGRTAHQRGTAHEFTPESGREAGRRGGRAVSENRDHMAAIGRRGGEQRSSNLRARSGSPELPLTLPGPALPFLPALLLLLCALPYWIAAQPIPHQSAADSSPR
jgi:hypothetical protein